MGLVVAVVVIAVACVGLYYYFSQGGRGNDPTVGAGVPSTTAAVEETSAPAQVVIESAVRAVVPEMGVNANPLSNAPNANPAERANPFRGVQVNPFQ
jgi:hypothetical protein